MDGTMRDVSWKFFAMTGNIDAYMLYKEMDRDHEEWELEEEERMMDEERSEAYY